MNRLERLADRLSPRLSVQLRAVKKRLQGQLDFELMDQFVRKGDTVVDAGANRGVYAHRLAQLVGPSGSVFAAEPFPDNVRTLRCIFGKRSNVTIWPVALSDAPGSSQFHVPVFDGIPIDALASLQEPSVEHVTVTVPLEPLDALLPPSRELSFIKCDVEGNELAVMRGADRLLREYSPTLLVEIEQRHHRNDIREVFAFMTELGYTGHFIQERVVRPLSEFDLEQHQLRYLGDAFVPYNMPRGYVTDFVFVHPRRWPDWRGVPTGTRVA